MLGDGLVRAAGFDRAAPHPHPQRAAGDSVEHGGQCLVAGCPHDGLLMSGHLASVAAAQGDGAIFTVFAAAVIGGVGLNGGKGTMFGAFTGILLLYMIQNVLTLAGLPHFRHAPATGAGPRQENQR
ncbi:hypothetical protein [Nonomuraea angiospora]